MWVRRNVTATRGTTVLAVSTALLTIGCAAAGAQAAWTAETIPFDGTFSSVSSAAGTTWAFGDHNGQTLAAQRTSSGSWERADVPDIGAGADTVVTAKDEAWAVGEGFSAGSSALRWDGAKWRTEPVPVADNISMNTVDEIGGEVWATGFADAADPYGYAVRWNGSKWTDAKIPRDTFTETEGVHGTSPDDVWVVGGRKDVDKDAVLPSVAHFDGDKWTKASLPGTSEVDDRVEIDDVVALAEDDVWVTGYRGSDKKALAWHFDGKRWSVDTGFPGAEFGPSDAVAVNGQPWVVGHIDNEATVLRYNAGEWQQLEDVPASVSKDVATLPDGRPILVGGEQETTPRPAAAVQSS